MDFAGFKDLILGENQSYSRFPISYGQDAIKGELINGKELFEIEEMEVFSVIG